MSTYFLSSKRLGFRHWKKDDLKIALRLWGDHEVTKLIDARGQLSEEQIQERLEKEIVDEKKYGVQYYPVFLLDANENVGCCGLRPYNLEKRIYEIGVHLRKNFWGKGYASEAVQHMMKYAFGELKAAALFAGHNPKNKASRRFLEKMGFQYTHDEYYAPTGLQHPSYILKADDFM